VLPLFIKRVSTRINAGPEAETTMSVTTAAARRRRIIDMFPFLLTMCRREISPD
jgi:hypothetical protein